MKRIFLFLATNIAVLVVLSVVINVFGLGNFLTAEGIDPVGLLVFSAVVGFAGSIISLLISKPMAKASHRRARDRRLGRHHGVLAGADGAEARASRRGIGMPEVAIYEGAPNAFATGAFKNSSLVAVSTGLLQSMSKRGGRGGARPRDRPRRQRRHGDAHAHPGRGQHLRHLPVAHHRLLRRQGDLPHRARRRPRLLHRLAGGADRCSASSPR